MKPKPAQVAVVAALMDEQTSGSRVALGTLRCPERVAFTNLPCGPVASAALPD